MQTMTRRIQVAAMALIPLAVGCSHQEKVNEAFFRGDDTVNPVVRFQDTQASCGARQDGTLYPQHFNGGQLNSLGEAKLDLLLHDDDAVNPLTVHIANGSTDAVTDAR